VDCDEDSLALEGLDMVKGLDRQIVPVEVNAERSPFLTRLELDHSA